MAKRLKWGTIEYLQELIEQYFAEAKRPNIAGLCLKLDIHRDTWHYYTSDKWRTNRLKDEELEQKQREAEKECEDGILEDDMEVSANKYLLEEFSQEDRRENEHIKSRVSDVFKKAQLRLEDYNNVQIYDAKNPAGPIFISKACFGYREAAPEQTEQNRLPASINIMVLPQPEKPKALEYVEVKAIDK